MAALSAVYPEGGVPMLMVDQSLSRPGQINKPNACRFRPLLERLEERLPPGDAFLGILAGMSFLSHDEHVFAELATDLISPPAPMGTSLTVDDLGDFGLSEFGGHPEFEQRLTPRLASTSSDAGDNYPKTFSPRQAISSRPQLALTPAVLESRGAVMTGARSTFQLAGSLSMSNGLATLTPVAVRSAAPSAPGSDTSSYQSAFFFEKNVGQADASFDYVARGRGYTLGVNAAEAVMAVEPSSAGAEFHDLETMTPDEKAGLLPDGRKVSALGAEPGHQSLVRMQIVGGNPRAEVSTAEPLVTRINYFLGNDPDQWHANVPTFGRLQYDEVYPGIDLLFYGNEQELEYDFIVAAGVDYHKIELRFAGADSLQLGGDGDLVIQAGDAQIRQHKPYIYQEFNGIRQEIAGSFALAADNRVTFEVGSYDTSRPLVIDPVVLSYSTYLGGPNYDRGYDVAVDKFGSAYVTGEASTSFPLVNPYQTFAGGKDAFVSKFSPDGATLIYSTYLGGTWYDGADSIAVTGQGAATITGFTESGNFPSTPGVFQPSNADGTCNGHPDCADAFVARLSPDGSTLFYSTYLGTVYTESGEGIAVDVAGNAYVMGHTNGSMFPTVNAVQPTFGGGSCTHDISTAPCSDLFITKLNPTGTALVYSTFLGGKHEEGYYFHETGDIAVDEAGYTYVTGQTQSFNFPVHNAIQGTMLGGGYAFVTKLVPSGAAFVYSTYLGGFPDGTHGYGIAADAAGNTYVSGTTWADNFPTTPDSFKPTKTGAGNNADLFISKISPNGSTFVYSTFFGGGETDKNNGIAVDGFGNAYVTGLTYSEDFPTVRAFQPNKADSSHDAFVSKLTADGKRVGYSSYLGGTDGEIGNAIAVDKTANAYIVGSVASIDFPSVNPYQSQNAGYRDVFLTKISRLLRKELSLNEP